MTSQSRMMKIGEVCRLVNGRAFKPSDWTESGLPIVRIQNLNDESKPFNYYDGPVKPQFLVDSGNILLSWSGTPGTSFGCFIWKRGRAILNQHIFRVHVDRKLLLDEYFVLAVNARLDQMIALAHGGVGLRHITKGKLDSISIPVPSLDKQQRVVTHVRQALERVDEIRALREETTAEARQLELAMFYDFLSSGTDWPSVALAEIMLSSSYGSSAKAHAEPRGVPVLRMGNIQSGCLSYDDLKYTELSVAELKKYRLEFGDILINRTNSLDLVGKAATFDRGDGDWVYASYLVRVRVDRRRVLPEFVTNVINSRIGRDYVRATARQAISMVNINAKEMGGFPIPLPPIEEQRAIIEKLARVRQVAVELRGDLESTSPEHLTGAILRKAFSGEL